MTKVWDEVLYGEETSVWADKGYGSAEREEAFKGLGKVWGVMRKAPKGGDLHPLDARANRDIAMVRAKVEHPFRVIKRHFGHVKTRTVLMNPVSGFICWNMNYHVEHHIFPIVPCHDLPRLHDTMGRPARSQSLDLGSVDRDVACPKSPDAS